MSIPAPGSAVPGISVVIPCFDAAATLPRALASLSAQTLRPLELIAVDDASRDSTLDCLRQFAIGAPFPVHIETLAHNGGAARARNAGIERASGEWIAFLDSDDAWHPAKLELQRALAIRSAAGLIGGYSDVAADRGDRAATARTSATRPDDTGSWPPLAALDAHPVELAAALWRNPFHTSTVLVRAQSGLRFPEGRHSEDYALWLALLRDGCPALQHQEGLARMYKLPYGAAGLSARLWAMERGELQALADGCRGRPWLLPPAALFSLARYARRALHSALR